jgi:hypothetical protein
MDVKCILDFGFVICRSIWVIFPFLSYSRMLGYVCCNCCESVDRICYYLSVAITLPSCSVFCFPRAEGSELSCLFLELKFIYVA